MEEIQLKLKLLLDKPEWTEDEKQWLHDYLETSDAEELRRLLLIEFSGSADQPQVSPSAQQLQNLRIIHKQIGAAASTRQPRASGVLFFRLAAAAAIVALCFTGIYAWLNPADKKVVSKSGSSRQQISIPGHKDILPGTNKAKLTLADGSSIILDDARNGSLATQGTTEVLKSDGKLTYQPSGRRSGEVFYNLISTPRGGQYHVELPDGSLIWLNAASSVRFPTVFAGESREVEITGEAYFEVIKNAAKPFVVKVNQSEIRVMGTHFNVMAYHEENTVKTTLLEGSVRVLDGSTSKILKPGQQSRLLENGHMSVKDGIDVNEVVAWKNGFFHFESDDIGTVMRQLSRWYDVDVRFSKSRNEELLFAEIPRDTKLSEALKALELTGKFKFELQGRTVIVM